MTATAPTGSRFLDDLLGGGIPRGTSVLLQRPPGDEKGATLAHLGRWQDALVVLNDVTRLDVRYPGVWVLNAKVLEHLGRPKMAASCLERAVELYGTERLWEVGPVPSIQKVRASPAARSALA